MVVISDVHHPRNNPECWKRGSDIEALNGGSGGEIKAPTYYYLIGLNGGSAAARRLKQHLHASIIFLGSMVEAAARLKHLHIVILSGSTVEKRRLIVRALKYYYLLGLNGGSGGDIEAPAYQYHVKYCSVNLSETKDFEKN
jgi:hypothetical protein